MKKSLVLMCFVLAVPALLFSAGAQGGATGEGGAEGATFARDADGIPDLEGRTITIWSPISPTTIKKVQNISETGAVLWLNEELNMDLQYIHPPQGQEQDGFSIMISSGSLPDIVMYMDAYYPGGIRGGFNDGVAWPVDDYIDEYAPNFKEKILADEQVARYYKNDNGQIIRFGTKLRPLLDNSMPGAEFSQASYIGPLMRKDLLKAAGFAVPVTIDDWYQVLSAMKRNGVEIPYGWGRSGRDQTQFVATFSGAYGVYEDFMIKEDGTVTYGPKEPAFRDYLAEMNKWYEEGLINPDFAVHKDAANVLPLAAAGKVGAYTTHLWNYQSLYFNAVSKDNLDVDYMPVPYPVLRRGGVINRFRHTVFGVGDEKTITVDAKDPIACVVFLDALYHDKINMKQSFGTEGVTYRYDENGNIRRLTVPEDFDIARTDGGGNSRLVGITLYSQDTWLNETGLDSIKLWAQADYQGKIPSGITMTPEETDLVSRYKTDLETYSREMITKFIAGVEPIEKFDEFVDQMEKMKVNELIGVYQDAVSRFMAR
jgi:putative aldouronate transport system substrate-binding protein